MRRQNQSQTEQSDDDCTSSASQILERVQADRVSLTKPEEDRRRRTIIVEKRNDSYGFTLQSYGIHYKKEQEIEMITYVDYVDYDGPAYRAGMREGDVILSINGTDMEKVDHKALVNFIKSCDSRMRMVVLFEDCVRKVELHIRYIQLQRLLQSKMAEWENLCVKEKQLLEGRWKTHSLPARKKGVQKATNADFTSSNEDSAPYCRPAASTEDMASKHQNSHNSSLVFTYGYLDNQYRYMLHPTSSSNEFLLTFDDGSNTSERHLVVKTPSGGQKMKQNKGNQTNFPSSEKHNKATSCHGYSGNLCNACVQVSNNSDNASLDAYDLASPCCDPHCVPSSRRRSKHHKDYVKRRDSKSEETQTDLQQPNHSAPRSRPHSQASQTSPRQLYSVPRRYFQVGAGLVSQCSLYSCTSSEVSATAPTTAGESSASHTTSRSTDTLFWNGSCDTYSSRITNGKVKNDCHRHSQPPKSEPVYVEYNSVKPKSWDNLATKAFGGYGFGGYGYIDSSGKSSRADSIRSNSSTKTQGTKYIWVEKPKSSSICQPNEYTPRRYQTTNKSTENFLSLPKYCDSVSSCECLNPLLPADDSRFSQNHPSDVNFGYYSAKKPNPKQISTSSEATRL